MRFTSAVALLSFLAGALCTRQSTVATRSYVDPLHGFALELPRFDPGQQGETVLIAGFYAPPGEGMTPNVNVLVEHKAYTVEQYQKATLDGLLATKKTMNSQKALKLGDRDALWFDYEGKHGELMLRHLALAVLTPDRTLVATCTATKTQFPRFEAMFQACLESFRLTAPPPAVKAPETKPAGK